MYVYVEILVWMWDDEDEQRDRLHPFIWAKAFYVLQNFDTAFFDN